MSDGWDSRPPFYDVRVDPQQERAARVAEQAAVYAAILRAAQEKALRS